MSPRPRVTKSPTVSPSHPDIARSLLHALLDRFEQPNRQQVARVRLSEREYPAYYSHEDAAPRHDTNAALERLAHEGVVVLRWCQWEEGNWLAAVDLRPEGAPTLYRLLTRAPRATQEDALRTLLSAQTPLPGWHAAFLAWAISEIDTHRAAPPLDREDLATSADLLRALAGVATLEAPTLERTLSVRLFSNSKRLSGLRGKLLRVLRRHDPDAPLYGDDDDALLRAHQLDRAPEYVPLAGSLSLNLPTSAAPLDLAPFWPSVALPAPLLRTAQVADLRARVVITVENLTSFSELCAIRPPDVFAIYTGGFASPTVIGLVRAITQADPAVILWHWGDLDAGGLRILAHLRANLGTVGALAMDVETFDAFAAAAQPLTVADRASLRELQKHAVLHDCVGLIDRLLAADAKLEQEAVPAAVALVSPHSPDPFREKEGVPREESPRSSDSRRD